MSFRTVLYFEFRFLDACVYYSAEKGEVPHKKILRYYSNKALLVDLGRYVDKVKCKRFNNVEDVQKLRVFNREGATIVTTKV